MSKITREEVIKIAALARIALSEDEIGIMTDKLSAIFGYLEVVKSAKVNDVEPMSHVHGSINVMRPDELQPSMDVSELLKIAPDTSGRFIRTPLVIEG